MDLGFRSVHGGRVPFVAGTIALALIVATTSVVMAAPPPTYPGGQKSGSALNMEVVGHTDLDNRGFNADVWVHDGIAYVGQWGFTDWATGNSRFCPSGEDSGVAVIDVSDPTDPTQISVLQNPPGTSAEDVVAFTARYGPLAGRDIAVVGIQVCGGARSDMSIERGLQVFDVTDPANPVEIGFWSSECCTRGIHELEVQHRDDLDRTFVYATVPTSRYPDDSTASGYRDEDGDGDFRLIDVTNPTNPFQVSSWGVQDAGGPWYDGQGCDADANYGHGVEPSADGRYAFMAYWDSGFIMLDLLDPANPVMVGRTEYPANADGDAHSSQFDEARELLFTADEDFCMNSGPGIERGYGYLRVYDYSDPDNPVQIGEFRTPNSMGPADKAAGDFTIHNNFLVGTDLYISWYSDGVRVVDTSDPENPVEVAYFVPPAGINPVKPSQRGVLTNQAQVWGVVVDEVTGLVYISDMNTGLWILERTDT